MTPGEAIVLLEDMQKQLPHGKRTFSDIADVIREVEALRQSALELVEDELRVYPYNTHLQALQGILTNDGPDDHKPE
jgi:hypothetical protein